MANYTLNTKTIWKKLLFSNIDVGDIPVDGSFNTNFTFSKFCGKRISERTPNLDSIAYGTAEQCDRKKFSKMFVLTRRGI